MPKSSEEAVVMTRKKPISKQIYFNEAVKELMRDLINLHIHSELYINEFRNKLDCYNIDRCHVFSLMDYDNNGFLTLNEVYYIIIYSSKLLWQSMG